MPSTRTVTPESAFTAGAKSLFADALQRAAHAEWAFDTDPSVDNLEAAELAFEVVDRMQAAGAGLFYRPPV